jgi:molecular chaperone GrpE (heat shock protein)
MKNKSEDDKQPISIRISKEMAEDIKKISNKDSVAAGVIALYKFYKENHLEGINETEQLLSLESEIKDLKNSPFGFDKKEILNLEKELEKAKEKFRTKKSESLKERLLKLVNSAG